MSKDAIIKKLSLLLVVCTLSLISCDGGEKDSDKEQDPISEDYGQPSAQDEAESTVVVDYAVSQGTMIKMGLGNGSSTTSALPGEVSRTWLQGLKSKVCRVWIQQNFVYNKGNIDRNYKYQNNPNNVTVEQALDYYSTTADSLLITLTGYADSGSYILPTGQAYIDFVRDNILYYKRKYPKIKYITVGNEPDHVDDPVQRTVQFYYEQGYKRYYQALHAANAILAQEIPNYSPILLGNGGLTGEQPNYANDFLKLYKADTDPTKKLSFFNFHGYGNSADPISMLSACQKRDKLMTDNGLPKIPVFLTELGNFGGTTLPAGFTLDEAVTAQPACMLTKMFYLYEGGISVVYNWLISHGTLQMKAELLDPVQGIASPYGHALVLATKLSDLETRIKGTSKGIASTGLGTHVLAAKKDKSISILVWNYNHDNKVADKTVQVLLKNIPKEFGTNKLHAKTYVIDSKNNNFHINPLQNTLSVTSEADYEHKGFLKIPVKLETNSVVLIELTTP